MKWPTRSASTPWNSASGTSRGPSGATRGIRTIRFCSVEVLEEGAKAFGWDKRNPTPGGAPGRFKRGFGVGMSQHHAGNLGYHDGEEAFARLAPQSGTGAGVFSTELELSPMVS